MQNLHISQIGTDLERTETLEELRQLVVNAQSLIANNESPGDMLKIQESSIKTFYKSIGHIARTLHTATDSLTDMQGDKSEAPTELATRPNSNFLEYVRNVTSTATDKTLDQLELAKPLLAQSVSEANNLDKQISEHLETAAAGTNTVVASELLRQTQALLRDNNQRIDLVNKAHDEILSMQSFQDLASQAISKAEELIQGVKLSLAELLQYFSVIDTLTNQDEATDTSTIEVHAAVNTLESFDASSPQLAQDDVDSLLEDLGF